MEELEEKVLYETRRHASRPFRPNYPPHQAIAGSKGSFLSLFRIGGRLRDKWIGYNQRQRIERSVSLFISSSGERVAVAAGNQITILRKEDDYLDSFGIFLDTNVASFTMGAWSESCNVLGVVDDTNTIYFIKSNGEEISRVTGRQLKVSLPIIGLIAEEDSDSRRSYLCTFIIVASDGSIRQMEISKEPTISFPPAAHSNSVLTSKSQFPNRVFCFDYYSDLSLFIIVGSFSTSIPSSRNSGSCYLSLWRSGILDLELLHSIQFDGVYSIPKGYEGQTSYSKLQVSPKAQFVATLDVTGQLYIFNLHREPFSISSFFPPEKHESQATDRTLNGANRILSDILDFTWWSDHILAISRRSGLVAMINILSGIKIQEDSPLYSRPIIERVQQLEGQIFLLECSENKGMSDPAKYNERGDLHHSDQSMEESINNLDISRLEWSLLSLTRRSVLEMYIIFIRNQKYQDALNFANCYGLDKDEILKSQWLHSDQGTNDMNAYLSKIKDQVFILSECIEKVGPTEDAVKAMLDFGLKLTNHYQFLEVEDLESNEIWSFRLARLRLLQFKDRLETYLGINMGRFSVQEYSSFRMKPIKEAAIHLAKNGKIGALNLLFKRHTYSMSPFLLEILSAIPETVPVRTYLQLLPGRSPPTSIAVREEDWVECQKMLNFIMKLPENHELSSQIRTEPIVKKYFGLIWPSIGELAMWYMKRARDIDTLSGQLDNCLCLLDCANQKGIHELQELCEDVRYLHQLIYSEGSDDNICIDLVSWEQLSSYDKFKLMLKGINEESVIRRLVEKAVPFMRKRTADMTSVPKEEESDLLENQDMNESFLVKWMKEIASENKLEICLLVIEEGCRDFKTNEFFRSDVEAVDCALQCIYLSTLTDRWSTMAGILSKLPQIQDTKSSDDLKRRLKLAEGHVEAQRLLSYYQVPKPMQFFLEGQDDGKGVKQIMRLILSKFIRRQSSRSDNDWTNMWHDMLCLKEKAFPFLDLEYMLVEFCRGLLKAGKFSLARNYLKGTSSVSLAAEKAENLVIQAAREYFFSASSLNGPEVWKAKECLNIFPSSRYVRAEVDIIDALTELLPSLGVTLLPVQFRQIKDPMEIIKMAISSQPGAYIHVEELIQVGKLLGLSSPTEISAVEEAIAREAAVAGDLQLAFDLCLGLTKKGHGSVWDLCAAIARGPSLENMDINSRKHLLGFSLSHCDEESISELLHAWKELDMQGQCAKLMVMAGTDCSNPPVQSSLLSSFQGNNIQNIGEFKNCFELVDGVGRNDQESFLESTMNRLLLVAKDLPVENRTKLATFLRENGKILSFAYLQLPWLLELSKNAEIKKLDPGTEYSSLKTQAIATLLSWLARNGFVPKDSLITSLAKSVIESPTKVADLTGCLLLLNLVDAFNGVEVFEEQLRTREDYQEASSIMTVGMTYCLLHDSRVACDGPTQRRQLLLEKFKEKNTFSSDQSRKSNEVESTFWREWKLKLEEQKRIADHSRALENIIPGVETSRFLSGDRYYIESVVLSLIESVNLEKKHILKDILNLANTYGMNRTEVLLKYLSSILVSELWNNEDIMVEISEFREEIIGCAAETIETISTVVYPSINGTNKLRLHCIYGLLADCYLKLEKGGWLPRKAQHDEVHASSLGLAHFYKIVEQECRRVAIIKDLNFKNISGLSGLNFEHFSREIYLHIDDGNIEALAQMVETLAGIYSDPVPEGLICSQDIYKHYILKLITTLETRISIDFKNGSPENFQTFVSQLGHIYDLSSTYLRLLSHSDALDAMKQYFTILLPLYSNYGDIPDNSAWQECLIILLNFYIRLLDEMRKTDTRGECLKLNPECLKNCLKVLIRLVTEDSVSPSESWNTIVSFATYGLLDDSAFGAFAFCRAMIFSRCGFGAVEQVFSESVSLYPTALNSGTKIGIQDIYLQILEPVLLDLVNYSHEHQNLHHLLSSLSRLEGDLENLRSTRGKVWERMAEFSDNLQLPSSVRVYVLELMQYITGRYIKGFSSELQYNVLPWEGWEQFQYTTKESDLTSIATTLDDNKDTSSRFTSTLVALKSTQLAATISPSLEVTSDDLSSIETTVSCFMELCAVATTDVHADSLLAILAEWEGLFLIERDEAEAPPVAVSGGNDWSVDGWDEGWESFQEVEPAESKGSETVPAPTPHPLHVCWTEIFKKLISLSRSTDVLRLVDESLSKSCGMLLDEDDAKTLCDILNNKDCFVTLKLAMLLPYEALRLRSLNAVESKLKRDGISDELSGDLDLLLLVLASGIVLTIVINASYDNTFSYLCYLVGNFSGCDQLPCLKQKGRSVSTNNRRELVLFRKITFPIFISELVKADQPVLAAFMVTKFMCTNPAVCLVNVAEASLLKYLKRELHAVQNDESGDMEELVPEVLRNTASSLKEKRGRLIESALLLLSQK
ncbi:MAG2-interacting protein 2 isoform X2 [Cucurbita maxima]|uniref:MAG2-interacting protein 2 isoform X2 n=1 Tax=Cucurbita maxima TaxID=3661 RepID=A0A6J1I6S6_CUCMA|nr:MAG2-interacting protein 2 isoform X2 [Cucurbita maxima]